MQELVSYNTEEQSQDFSSFQADQLVNLTPNSCYNVTNEFDDLSAFSFEVFGIDQLWEDASQLPKPASKAKKFSRGRIGLKIISSKLKEVLKKLGSAKYMVVAEQLLHAFDSEEQQELTKNEKSYHRRVYDVLNILVAAQVFSKSGKYIAYQTPKPANANILNEKRLKLRNLSRKYSMLKNLYERNLMQNKTKPVLSIPFQLVPIPLHTDYEVKIKKSKESTQLAVISGKPTQLIDDDACLLMMGLSNHSSFLPYEVNRLCFK